MTENVLENQLAVKIQERRALVGIIGLGYVGLPLALTFAEKGFTVLGFDVDSAKVEALGGRPQSYIKHLDRAAPDGCARRGAPRRDGRLPEASASRTSWSSPSRRR